MANNKLRLHLICYDIADPKRLGRVHRFLRKQALPVQYSVFIAYVAPRTLAGILAGINEFIEPREDDVRCYTLPSEVDIVEIGRHMLPEGVALALKGVRTGLFGHG